MWRCEKLFLFLGALVGCIIHHLRDKAERDPKGHPWTGQPRALLWEIRTSVLRLTCQDELSLLAPLQAREGDDEREASAYVGEAASHHKNSLSSSFLGGEYDRQLNSRGHTPGLTISPPNKSSLVS